MSYDLKNILALRKLLVNWGGQTNLDISFTLFYNAKLKSTNKNLYSFLWLYNDT